MLRFFLFQPEQYCYYIKKAHRFSATGFNIIKAVSIK